MCTNPVTPPACAGTLVDDAIALAYGANDPPAAGVDRQALRDQLRCQQQIGRAVAKFVGDKLKNLIRGRDAGRGGVAGPPPARQAARTVRGERTQDVSGVIVPDVGATCDGNVGAPGTAVEPEELRDCLIARARGAVDAVSPNGPPVKPNLIIILTDDQRWDTTDAHPLARRRDARSCRTSRAGSVDRGRQVPERASSPRRSAARAAPSILRGPVRAHDRRPHQHAAARRRPELRRHGSTLATWLDAAGLPHRALRQVPERLRAALGRRPRRPTCRRAGTSGTPSRRRRFYDYTLVENGVGFPITRR